jgi:predicted HTH domain antitoxin
MSATLELPEDVLRSARITPDEAKRELAIVLFSAERLSLGKAAEFAGVPVWQFQAILTARRIGPHYDRHDALRDAATLASIADVS